MISGIVNKIKAGAEKLDHNVSQRPWSSRGYLPDSWFIPKAVYGALKYLVYHPTRLIIKGFPYAVNLEQTWKQNIRPKIPFGNPDVYFDVEENKTTSKDYGTRFDPIMKKKDYNEDVRVKVPKYKLLQRSMQQFEAWLESSEEDKKNENFIPKSSDKKKFSADEQKAYYKLIDLYKFLKEKNGTVKVEGEELVIRIDVTNKTLEEIEERVEHCCNALDMPRDTKMIGTIASRLYKKTHDREISSDEPFAKTKQQQSVPEEPDLTSRNTDVETGETIKGKGVVQKEEQMSNNMDCSQFSLTNTKVFPTNVVNLQSKKGPNELQNDLISCYKFPEVEKFGMSNIENKVVGIAVEDLRDVSLSTTNTNSPYITGNRRREEISRGG